MKSFLEFLQSTEASPELVSRLTSGIQQKSVPKGMLLQTSGQSGHSSYFVRKGLLRSFFIDERGKEHVFMFAPEGWIVGDFESQTFDQPTVLSIDVLEDSEVDVIDARNFSSINDLPAEVLQQQIQKLVRRISVLQHRVLMLMSASASARYEEFIKTYPNVSQRVPQRMIASYLGVTPEALSKIRGELAKN